MLACKTCFVQSCLGQIFRLSFPISVPRKTPDARINIQWQKHHQVLHFPKKNGWIFMNCLLLPNQRFQARLKHTQSRIQNMTFLTSFRWIFTLYWIFIQRLTADNIDFCFLVIDDQFNKKNHEIMRIIYRWLLVFVLFLYVKYGNQLEKSDMVSFLWI